VRVAAGAMRFEFGPEVAQYLACSSQQRLKLLETDTFGVRAATEVNGVIEQMRFSPCGHFIACMSNMRCAPFFKVARALCL